MKNKHTPTPFDFGVREDGSIWISGGRSDGTHHFQQDFYGTADEAAYIKTAVNSHDELLAALKKAKLVLEHAHGMGPEMALRYVSSAIANAEKA